MDLANFSRWSIITFVSSILITVMVYVALSSLGIAEVVYVGALCGMYVFAVYGINLLVDNEIIPNNYSRFILAIAYIIIYSVVFVYLMPYLFGENVLSSANTLAHWGYSGFGSDIILNKEFFLTLFAVIVMIVNFMDYRKG